jgi:para-nitrobenzyl esterase
LQDAVVGYWTRFARSGNPEGQGTSWPEYEPTSDSYLELDYTIVEGAGVRTTQCDFWDTLVP